MDDQPGESIGLSDATLRIERSGPNEKHWSIVDLPGLIPEDTYVKVQENDELSSSADDSSNDPVSSRSSTPSS